MRYIKCNNCNYFNLINSTFQIFCDNCGKKLDNNFKNWHKNNPTKNFEDFKREVGEIKRKEIKKNKSLTLKKTLQVAFLIICLSTLVFFGKKIGSNSATFFSDLAYPTSELLHKEWRKQFFLNKSITLQSPFLLTKEKGKVAPEVKNLITAINNYSFYKGNEFGLILATYTYSKKIKELNLEVASEGGINLMMQKLQGKDLTFKDVDTTVNQHAAILKEGSFTSQKNKIYFRMVTCTKNKNDLIILMTCWLEKNEDYNNLSSRIINSLEVR